MKIITLNAEGHRFQSRWLEWLRAQSADVVCLQEIFESQLPEIERKLGMKSAFAANIDFTDPRQMDFGPPGFQGVAILTRGRFDSIREFNYTGVDEVRVKDVSIQSTEDPNTNAPTRQPVLVTDVVLDGHRLRVATLHFTWSKHGVNSDTQREHLEQLFAILESCEELVVCADMNIPRSTVLGRTIETRFDSWVPADVGSTIDTELHRNGVNAQNVVDYFLTLGDLVSSSMSIHDGLSDHKAIVGEVGRRGPEKSPRPLDTAGTLAGI